MKEKNMKRVCVGIDSCNNLENTMIVAGPEEDFVFVHDNMMQILGKNGIKIPHYKKIERKKRDKISRPLAKLFTDSNKISFVFFEHKRPMQESKKRYLFEYVPNKLVEHLCGFDNRNRFIQIDVHDDYKIFNLTTDDFVEALVRRLSRRMSTEDKGIKIIPEDGYKKSKIFTAESNYIKIRGKCVTHTNSKSVNIADMSMGLFRDYNHILSGKLKVKII